MSINNSYYGLNLKIFDLSENYKLAKFKENLDGK